MMQKDDELKFGKHKGKTWGDLLKFEDGQNWLRWWSETPSTGKYANYENKQKALIKEWLGEPKIDTRGNTQVLPTAIILNKLEIIEGLLNALIKQNGNNPEPRYENQMESERVVWDE
jgi:hypothetical protein